MTNYFQAKIEEGVLNRFQPQDYYAHIIPSWGVHCNDPHQFDSDIHVESLIRLSTVWLRYLGLSQVFPVLDNSDLSLSLATLFIVLL